MSEVRIMIVKTVVDAVKTKIADVSDVTLAARYCPDKQDLDATMPQT